MDLKELAQDFRRSLLRIEAEWIAERDSDPINIDHGKEILEQLCQLALDFRTDVVLQMGDRQCRPISVLDEQAQRWTYLQQANQRKNWPNNGANPTERN